MAFRGDRTLSAADEIAQMAVDELADIVPHLWIQAHPLLKRWTGITDIERGAGVRSSVLTEVSGGDDFRARVNYAGVTASGRADQAASFSQVLQQRYSSANWNFLLHQAWLFLGQHDIWSIGGDNAKMFNYVKDQLKVCAQSLAEKIAFYLYGSGYVLEADGAGGVITMQGLSHAIRTSNMAFQTASDGYYGNVDRSQTDAQFFHGNETAITSALQIADLQSGLTTATEGLEAPTMGVCGRTVYNILWSLAEAKQRLINTADPALGFTAPLSFNGVPIFMDRTMDNAVFTDNAATASGAFFTSSTLAVWLNEFDARVQQGFYFLNENFIRLAVLKGSVGDRGAPRVMPELESTGSLVRIGRLAWDGCLAVTHPRRCWAGTSITT